MQRLNRPAPIACGKPPPQKELPLEQRLARSSDPDTSTAAAAQAARKAKPSQELVLRILRSNGPLADFQIAWHAEIGWKQIRCSSARLRTARNELVKRGLVRDSGQRRRTASGARAIVWKLV